jgi:transcriptional regulator with XRE-family HTH domain
VDAAAEAKERAWSRNPLTDEEIPYAKWLGSSIRLLRTDAGFTVGEFADRAQISRWHLWKLENGLRHTRASTLGRLAAVLAPRLGEDPEELAALLVRVAGPALAPEALPEHQERIDRRREKRVRHNARMADQIAYARMRLRELRPPTTTLRGPDGKWLPWRPTPEQLASITERYRREGLVVPPIDEEGRFILDSPLLMHHINAMHARAGQ